MRHGLPDGTLTTFQASDYTSRTNVKGVPKHAKQVSTWTHQGSDSLLLKPFLEAAFQSRERCFLERLPQYSWVPWLVCLFDGGLNVTGLILESAGEPVSALNIPRDYRAQAIRILNDLREAGVSHNDIWQPLPKLHGVPRNTAAAAGPFSTELLVDPRQQLSGS